jgi:predicted nucleic acid-binding protein
LTAALIIDCSITMAWCFADEATEAAARVLDRLETEAALVPALWFLEVTNVLASAERRQRITAAQSTEFLMLLSAMEIDVDHEAASRALSQILPLCRSEGLTSYDATYLELALRRRLPLATLDAELRSAAGKLGIDLLGK